MDAEKHVSSWEAYQEALKISRALKVFDQFEAALKVLAESERRTQQYETEAKQAIATRDAALEAAEAVAQELVKGEAVVQTVKAEAETLKQDCTKALKLKRDEAALRIQAMQAKAQDDLLKIAAEYKHAQQEVAKLEKVKIALEGQLVDLRKQLDTFRATIATTFTKVN